MMAIMTCIMASEASESMRITFSHVDLLCVVGKEGTSRGKEQRRRKYQMQDLAMYNREKLFLSPIFVTYSYFTR